jgi:anti-anti-sigma factor
MRETSDIAIDISTREDALILRVGGEVDLWTVHRLGDALATAQASDAHSILVDLDHVTFMDSTGLHALIQYAVAPEMRGRLTVTNGSPQVRRLFQVSGVGRYLSFASPPRTPLRVIAGQGSTTQAPR